MSKDVSNYISNIEEAKLRSLARTIRSVVKSALHESEEIIWMGIPTYRVHGKPIVEIADYTGHINLYFVTEVRDCLQDCFKEAGRECGTSRLPRQWASTPTQLQSS